MRRLCLAAILVVAAPCAAGAVQLGRFHYRVPIGWTEIGQPLQGQIAHFLIAGHPPGAAIPSVVFMPPVRAAQPVAAWLVERARKEGVLRAGAARPTTWRHNGMAFARIDFISSKGSRGVLVAVKAHGEAAMLFESAESKAMVADYEYALKGILDSVGEGPDPHPASAPRPEPRPAPRPEPRPAPRPAPRATGAGWGDIAHFYAGKDFNSSMWFLIMRKDGRVFNRFPGNLSRGALDDTCRHGSCGRYRWLGNTLTITWDSGRVWRGPAKRFPGSMDYMSIGYFDLVPATHMLQGRYSAMTHAGGAFVGSTVSFGAGGTYRSNAQSSATVSATRYGNHVRTVGGGSSSGAGQYRIQGTTIVMTDPAGQRAQMPFLVGGGGGNATPSVIFLRNTLYLRQ